MDQQIDYIFERLFRLASKDDAHEVEGEISKLLVILECLLPVYHRAVDLIEQHCAIASKQQRQPNGEDTKSFQKQQACRSRTPGSVEYGDWDEAGVFTLYSGTWEGLATRNAGSRQIGTANKSYEYWHVQPVKNSVGRKNERHAQQRRRQQLQKNEEARGIGRSLPLEVFEDFGLVSLEHWECSCAEYTATKYNGRRIARMGGNGKSKSGWGRGYYEREREREEEQLEWEERVPQCVHLVGVFLFVHGRALFEWNRRVRSLRSGGGVQARLDLTRRGAGVTRPKERDTEAGLRDPVSMFERTDFVSMDEYLGLVYRHRLSRAALAYVGEEL